MVPELESDVPSNFNPCTLNDVFATVPVTTPSPKISKAVEVPDKVGAALIVTGNLKKTDPLVVEYNEPDGPKVPELGITVKYRWHNKSVSPIGSRSNGVA